MFVNGDMQRCVVAIANEGLWILSQQIIVYAIQEMGRAIPARQRKNATHLRVAKHGVKVV
jgi:hypothetical protein